MQIEKVNTHTQTHQTKDTKKTKPENNHKKLTTC